MFIRFASLCALTLTVVLAAAQSCLVVDGETSCAVPMSSTRRAAAAGETALIQRQRAVVSSGMKVFENAEAAAVIRQRLAQESDVVAAALSKGIEVVAQALVYLMVSPPNMTAAVQTLASGLFSSFNDIVPASAQSSAAYTSFHTEWMASFMSLASTIQSVRDDVETFKNDGDTGKLVHSMTALIIDASTTVTNILPEETSALVARYLGGVADLIGGVGDALEAYVKGDSTLAMQMIYTGIQAATHDLLPPELQNDTTYRAMVSLLDGSIGNLSASVLAYKQHMMESNVCWKTSEARPRKRPSVCDEGYAFDGEQWCIFRGVAPFTIQSRTNELYLNVRGGSTKDGANVWVWNNPGSWHTQWTMSKQADGTYLVENVNSHTFLYAQGQEPGSNVAVTDLPQQSARWRLHNLAPGLYTVENVAAPGLYLNLQGGGAWSGTNVQLLGSPESKDCQWRIRSAWGGQTLDEVEAKGRQTTKPALLEASLRGKEPSGALPARCGGDANFSEKSGAWCLGDCRVGFNVDGSRCTTACSSDYPVDSSLMCAKSPGMLAAAIAEMLTDTVRQALSVANLAEQMQENGLDVAAGLTGTMQAFVDAGKAFAHPLCKAPLVA